MFSRRVPLTQSEKLREMIWPRMGPVRAGRYMMHRLLRIKDTTHKVAFGLALGVAVSFTPLPGTHIFQAIFLAWALRANVLAALIGTLAGNPLTLPFMWLLAYKLGAGAYLMLGLPVDQMPEHFTLHHLLQEIMHPWGLFLPWLLGGYLLAVLSLPPAYGFFYWLVQKMRKQRIIWKQNRVHRMAVAITEKKT